MKEVKQKKSNPLTSASAEPVQKSQKPPAFSLDAGPIQKKEGEKPGTDTTQAVTTTTEPEKVAAATTEPEKVATAETAAPVAAAPEAAAATTVNASDVTITFGANANTATVGAGAQTVIKEICAKAGEKSCTITSTARTPEDQARAMYNNLEQYGVDAQKGLYANPGDQVIDVYSASKKAGKTADQIKADMVAKINELGPSTVSNHCADSTKLCVVDIDPASITNKTKFIEEVGKDTRVSKFLQPPADPAYHLEIPV